MTSDSKMAAPLDPAVLAERFQTLATKSQAAVQGFLVDRPDVANIGMDPLQAFAVFSAEVRPLKIGIHRDLRARCPGVSRTQLRRALDRYVNRASYWQTMLASSLATIAWVSFRTIGG